jgi:PAS domain S-box-containing protein
MFKLSYPDAASWLESLVGRLDGGSASDIGRQSGIRFRDLPRPARLWLIFIAALYIAMALSAAPHTRLIVLVALIPVFALAGLVKPGPHPSGGIRDANSIILIIAVLVWTPAEVILGVGIGSFVGGRLFRRAEWWRTGINAASWAISGGIAATLAQSLMSVLPQGALRIVTGASAAVLANFVTNRLMFSLVRSYRFRRPFLPEWRQSLFFGWSQELLDLPVIIVIVAVAYAIGDLAWSLAITTAEMLLLPLNSWVERRYLDIIMQKRACAVLTKSQVAAASTGESSDGGAERPGQQPSWLAPIRRLFDGQQASSAPWQHINHIGLHQDRMGYFYAILCLAYVAAACWSIPSSRLQVVAGIAIILAATTAFGYFPNPLGHGPIFPVTHVKILCALLFSPQEVVLGVGIGAFIGHYLLLPKSEAWRAASTASAWGLSAGAAAILAHVILSRFSPIFVSAPSAALLAVIANRTVNAGIWALFRDRLVGYSFLSEWVRGVFARLGFQALDIPVSVTGVLVVHYYQTVEVALIATATAALLVPLARWELGRQYDRAVNNRVAAALRQSEKRLGALIQHISEGILLINAEGTTVYASPSASRVLGYESSEHVGRSWFEFYHPEDIGRVRPLFSSLVREPGSHFTVEARMLHKDGSWKWIHTSQANLLMEPSVRAIVVTYRDITHGRRSEETLEEYAARLEDLSRQLVQTQETERRRIAQELHDETGQILTGLKLTLDVALRQIGEGDGRSTLSRAAAMLETLQKQVRTLSLNLRPVALDDLGLLPAVLMLCNQYEVHMSVRVRTIHNGISGRRFASEIETTAYRIVQEGLTNVARHASVPEATVRLWTDEEVLGIQVEDCGKGFAVELAEFVARSSGLSGMRERVLLVGGEFTIESTPGTGTRLTAELPLGQPAIGALAAKDSS